MCKACCRIISTIYLCFIFSLLFTATYYSIFNDNTNYLVIPLAIITGIIFMIIIRNIIIIIKRYYNTAIITPIVELKEVIIDNNNFIKVIRNV